MKTFQRAVTLGLILTTIFVAVYYAAYRSARMVRTGMGGVELRIFGISMKGSPTVEKVFYWTFYPLIRLSDERSPEEGFEGTILHVSPTKERFAVKLADDRTLLINTAKDRAAEIASLHEGDKVRGSYVIRNGRNEAFSYYYFLRKLEKE